MQMPSLSRRGSGGGKDPGAEGPRRRASSVCASRQEGLHTALHAQERQPAQRSTQALAEAHLLEVRTVRSIVRCTYRVTHLLANLGWVDFYLGCSTILPRCSATSAKFPPAQAESDRQ